MIPLLNLWESLPRSQKQSFSQLALSTPVAIWIFVSACELSIQAIILENILIHFCWAGFSLTPTSSISQTQNLEFPEDNLKVSIWSLHWFYETAETQSRMNNIFFLPLSAFPLQNYQQNGILIFSDDKAKVHWKCWYDEHFLFNSSCLFVAWCLCWWLWRTWLRLLHWTENLSKLTCFLHGCIGCWLSHSQSELPLGVRGNGVCPAMDWWCISCHMSIRTGSSRPRWLFWYNTSEENGWMEEPSSKGRLNKENCMRMRKNKEPRHQVNNHKSYFDITPEWHCCTIAATF